MHVLIFLKILRDTGSEPPSRFYSRPNNQQQPPPFMPTYPPASYGPPISPPIPSTSYGVPQSSYGLPTASSQYGPPAETTPAPIIHKHVYVHVPPPEPDYPPALLPTAAVQPMQKHYRIIFIKAPSNPAPTPPVAAAAQSEEKTIVYVLVKKPDDMPPITAAAPAATVPSKPEVYFIRYKTEETTTGLPEIISDNGGYYRK